MHNRNRLFHARKRKKQRLQSRSILATYIQGDPRVSRTPLIKAARTTRLSRANRSGLAERACMLAKYILMDRQKDGQENET